MTKMLKAKMLKARMAEFSDFLPAGERHEADAPYVHVGAPESAKGGQSEICLVPHAYFHPHPLCLLTAMTISSAKAGKAKAPACGMEPSAGLSLSHRRKTWVG